MTLTPRAQAQGLIHAALTKALLEANMEGMAYAAALAIEQAGLFAAHPASDADVQGEKSSAQIAYEAATVGADLPPYGTRFTYHGNKYTIIAYQKQNWKYPFICQRASNGKRYKLSKLMVTNAVGKGGSW